MFLSQRVKWFTVTADIYCLGECKPNFDLWFSGSVSLCAVMCRKTLHSCKDTKIATPLDFCRAMLSALDFGELNALTVAFIKI